MEDRYMDESNIDMNSILESIKKCSGVSNWDSAFDSDLILFINSNFLALGQMGIESAKSFSVTDESTLWTDLMKDGPLLNAIKSWLYLKTRLEFDPPTGSALDSYKAMINEYEWRICSEVDYHGGLQN